MNEDRKTPEMRAQMTEIERLRHSASHVLATAILRIWPEAQFAAGPPVENGFYYDVELPHRISPDDFEKIEAEMKKETKAKKTIRSSSASTAPPSRTKRSSTNTSPCSRKRRSVTIGSSAKNLSYSL